MKTNIQPVLKRLFSVLALIIFASFVGCGPTSSTNDQPKQGNAGKSVRSTFEGNYPIRVVVTTGQVADLVRNVCGKQAKHVEIVQLIEGEGIDPHTYVLPPRDVETLGKADIIFYSGLHLEGKMSDVLVKMARNKETFAVTEYIDHLKVLEDEEEARDPHLWFDVALWSGGVNVVRDVMAKFDPDHADEYKKNANLYQEVLIALDQETEAALATIPKERRVLVTAHDAFRYFGRAYDIEVRGLQGISTESEASLKRVNELVDFLVRRKIKAVFVEKSIAKKNINSLIEGCEAQGHTVVVGGELFSDSMGESNTPESTYAGVIRHNYKTIVKALK